jgi:hypothetical protein
LVRDDVVVRAQRADNAFRRASLLVHEQQSPSFRCVQVQGFGGRDHSRFRVMRGPIAQFIDRKLQPNQRPNASNQRDFVDRLGQEVVGAGFETAHAIGRPVERGQEDNWQVSGFRRDSQSSTHLQTVHAGHFHVEKNDVATALFADGDRIGAVGRGQHLEILDAESRLEQFEVGRDIVDD